MNSKNIIFKSSFLVFLFLISFLFSVSVYADSTCNCKNSSRLISDCGPDSISCKNSCGVGEFVSCEAASGDLKQKNPSAGDLKNIPPQSLPNPLGITDVNAFIAQLINFVLSLVGSVSLLLFVYGGITWMTSAGAPAAVKKGKDIVVWAVIGLAVVFTSYILVKFVIQGITGA